MDDAYDPNSTLPARFGRYHVMAAIPGGAMGRLYLGQDPEIDRMVVIKALDSGSSQEQKTRFLREARAAGRLNHPNVVSIFDVGEHERTPFIVMEYIEGETLSAIVRNREPILFSKRLEIIDQLCAGLAYAHDAGVVHRDIKPSNLMLDKTGKLRILDFGIARLDTSDQTQTSTGIVGTLNYMSPEQWEGGVIEGRSDMFSVGAVMYELFSFSKAFPGSTPPEVLRYMFGEGPRPLREVCPLAPPALAEVVARMLARTPEDRFASLHEVRDAIAGLRAQVLEMPADAGDKTVQMSGVAIPSGASGAPTSGGTQATRPTGWPVRPGATATQAPVQITMQPGGAPIPAAAPVADENRTVRFVLIGVSFVAVIGIAGWLLLHSTPAGSGNATPAAATTFAPAGASPAATPPATSPATPGAVSPPVASTPSGSRLANEAGTAPPTTAKSSSKTAPTGGRGGAARGADAAPPPVVPAAPVHLKISWSQPFEIIQNGQKLSKAPGKSQDLEDVRPDRGEVYAHSEDLRLHYRIPTDKSDSIRLPEPGHLAVTLTPQYLECWVVVDGTDFRKGPIIPGRPAMIAAQKQVVTLRCPNGLKVEPQTTEVRSGLDPTILSFPRDGGG